MKPKRTKEQQELVDHLKGVWQEVLNCDAYVVGNKQRDEMKWTELASANKVTGQKATQALLEIERVEHTFHYISLTAICTFLEDAARRFAAMEFPVDYERRYKAKKKAGKGSDFSCYIDVVKDSGRFDENPIKNQLATIMAAIRIRNYVVHSWGRVPKADRPKAKKIAESIGDSEVQILEGIVFIASLANIVLAAEDIGNALIDQLLPLKTRKDSN